MFNITSSKVSFQVSVCVFSESSKAFHLHLLSRNIFQSLRRHHFIQRRKTYYPHLHLHPYINLQKSKRGYFFQIYKVRFLILTLPMTFVNFFLSFLIIHKWHFLLLYSNLKCIYFTSLFTFYGSYQMDSFKLALFSFFSFSFLLLLLHPVWSIFWIDPVAREEEAAREDAVWEKKRGFSWRDNCPLLYPKKRSTRRRRWHLRGALTWIFFLLLSASFFPSH